MNELVTTFLTSLITAIVTLGGAWYNWKGKHAETGATVESAYLSNSDALFKAYQGEMNRLNEKVAKLEERIETMQRDHQNEMARLESENDDLRNKLRDVIAENKVLKIKIEELTHGN